MKRIAFFGLGKMGAPMATNLARRFEVVGFDISGRPVESVQPAASAREAAKGADAIVTALPTQKEVEAALTEVLGEFSGRLVVDCSTVPTAFAKRVGDMAAARGVLAVDAPMSGGVPAATNAGLSFMVGGSDDAVEASRPLLETMGTRVIHAGPKGAGATAKLCNNMMLASQMIAVAEGMTLAEKLGLSPAALYEISSNATARCWSLNDYPPVAGLGTKTSPANFDFKPGFAAALMLKDLRIAMDAARASHHSLPLAERATELYRRMCDDFGHSHRDFSAIIDLLRDGRLSDSAKTPQ